MYDEDIVINLLRNKTREFRVAKKLFKNKVRGFALALEEEYEFTRDEAYNFILYVTLDAFEPHEHEIED